MKIKITMILDGSIPKEYKNKSFEEIKAAFVQGWIESETPEIKFVEIEEIKEVDN